jgi:glyoxylate reductase
MKPRVFISRPIPPEPLALIQAECEVEMWSEVTVTPPIAEKIVGKDGLLTYGHELVTGAMMDTAPNLRAIANMGVGYDHIDVKAATERGIPVGNTPGVLDETVADMAFTLLLATARNTLKGDHYVRSGTWKVYNPNILWGAEIHGSTIGLIGFGRIGRAIARRARGFNMNILYYRRQRIPEWEQELGAHYTPLDELLAQADFVVLMVPLKQDTHHLIGARELGLMKKTAILINAARGPVVDSKALYEALRDGKIAGAGLDVFDPEPPLPDDPLLSLENVVLTPHLGSATVKTRTRMGMMAAENLLAGLRGEPLPYQVNPGVKPKSAGG